MSELIRVRRFAEVQRVSEPYFCFNVGSVDGLMPLQSQQSTTNHVQIGQRTSQEQSIGILHETAVAHLGETPQPFDDMEGVLAARAMRRTLAIDLPLMRCQGDETVAPGD